MTKKEPHKQINTDCSRKKIRHATHSVHGCRGGRLRPGLRPDRRWASTPRRRSKTRSVEELHQAALEEGGAESIDEDALKREFESHFPGLTPDLTADLSKYHSPRFDEQLAADNIYVERLRLFFEDKLGTAQGLRPLTDGI
ncbi:uncharacterized protein PpBr36_10285 [Pyricularia pennisetigena]|uniref:uncharacterized protein n=1 Tax=Pyricularia pennisetigena TaxID=1578925 RepID=UPI00114EAD3B|nr:uncharacterized protein PpBr36_10285 [Pyricularia pennisetigena]TLS21409.1 hypothetical protein PpBr36_10285 [Pyricularia pennisetigena]